MAEAPLFLKFIQTTRANSNLLLNTDASCKQDGLINFPSCFTTKSIPVSVKISRRRRHPPGSVQSTGSFTKSRSQSHGNSDAYGSNSSQKLPSERKQQVIPAVKKNKNRGTSDLEKKSSKPSKTGYPELSSNLVPVRESSTSAIATADDEKGTHNAAVFLNVNSQTTVFERAESTQSKKKRRHSPEGKLRFGLDMCSKRGDLLEAISLYDKALSEGVELNQHHYNVLLYICSSAAMGVLRSAKSGSKDNSRYEHDIHPSNGDHEMAEKDKDGTSEDEAEIEITEEMMELALKRGFEIYQQMHSQQIPPNEATFTSVARLAVAKGDGDLAFEMVKQMPAYNVVPRLRSFSPALFAFCKNMEVEKAYEVDAHMAAFGIQPEEPELAALLKLSAEAGREERVYSLLHRLRASIRQVSPSTANIIEQWFKSKVAKEVGTTSWDTRKIREASVARGGGWHGQGWLNKGEWKIRHTTMTHKGVCRCCREQLVTIDIDPSETEKFAKSIAALALQREAESDFTTYQEWLDNNGPYEAIIDGANVCLYQQKFAERHFSFSQLNAVVNGIRERSREKKWPLIILHNKRTRAGPANEPGNKLLIEKWKRVGALYTTPTGSNDDWYWLYAAVRFKCLLITVDEMRDHLFALLGNDFFPKWKERHQVRFTFTKYGPRFHMPPPYSIVIQESERGSWHIPIVGGDDIEISRKWLCITRSEKFQYQKQNNQASQNRIPEDSQFSKLEDTHEMIYQSKVPVDEIKFSTDDSTSKKIIFSDSFTEAASVTTRGKMPKHRSFSSPYGSKKNRKGHSVLSPPTLPTATETRQKIEAAEKHRGFTIDFQI